MTVNALDLACERPWLMAPEALETLLTVAARLGDPEALAARLGRPLDNTHEVVLREGGVAVIPVVGPLFRRANLMTELSGATSTEILATDLQAALDDPQVRAIALDIDSPGGEVSGIHELASRIREAGNAKPLTAYVGGYGASGAYWLASAAPELVIDATARLGSIGVVMAWRDTREREAKNGVRTIEIVSSQSPLKRASPDTDEGRAEIQRMVDELAEVFIAAVARNRQVGPETVAADFGRGGLLVGESAVRAGMADRLGSLESVIAELAGRASARRGVFVMTAATAPIIVRTTAELRAALAANTDPERIEIAEPPSPVPSGVEAVDADAIRAEARVAERSRILEILTLSAPGFEAEIRAAIEEGLSPDRTAMRLVKASRERGLTLEAIAADSTRAPHAPAPQGEAGERKAVVSAILAGAKR